MNSNLDVLHNELITLQHKIEKIPKTARIGKLVKATGMALEAKGIKLPLGASCLVEKSELSHVECEVVGFSGESLYLMPLSNIEGIQLGAKVIPKVDIEGIPTVKKLPLGEELLGRVLDASGKPLDNLGKLDATVYEPLQSSAINPMHRTPISTVLDVGVKAINSLLTVGKGQRMGLFAGSGVGKSVLLGMMSRFTEADIVVVGLIGERGREVKSFIEDILGSEGLKRSVVVAAPADVSPIMRMQGASYATKIAEYFRDKGNNVLLIMDSLTRYAMAQREIALAIGEPPATKGYPPSVFAKLPSLVERAGNGSNGCGSITAFYTVLTEGDDQQDPVADSARAILDGHIVLSRQLAESGHYPAIDIEASISRAMTDIISQDEFSLIRRFKQLYSIYQRNRDLINVGAYVSGSDPNLDLSIKLYPYMEQYLQQNFDDKVDYENSNKMLRDTLSSI